MSYNNQIHQMKTASSCTQWQQLLCKKCNYNIKFFIDKININQESISSYVSQSK